MFCFRKKTIRAELGDDELSCPREGGEFCLCAWVTRPRDAKVEPVLLRPFKSTVRLYCARC